MTPSPAKSDGPIRRLVRGMSLRLPNLGKPRPYRRQIHTCRDGCAQGISTHLEYFPALRILLQSHFVNTRALIRNRSTDKRWD